MPRSSSLDAFLLGIVELDSILELQSRARIEIAVRDDRHGSILVCEHPPCITIGDDGSLADVHVDFRELISRAMEVRWCDRSGGTFVHLPGQLSVYITVPLQRLGHDLLTYSRILEDCLIGVAHDMRVTAERSPDVPGACGRNGQFGFVGVSNRDGIACGGFHINVSLPQESLDLVRWSESGIRATSLATLRGRPTAMSTVRESVLRHVTNLLGYDEYNLLTSHPLLCRSNRKVALSCHESI
jgi:lipoate-protein ligase B